MIQMSPESVADLVDLEQELSSIQRGITQMERITPIEPPKNPTEDDPFGDSFTQYPVRMSEHTYNRITRNIKTLIHIYRFHCNFFFFSLSI